MPGADKPDSTWLNCPGCRHYLGMPRTGAEKCPSCGAPFEDAEHAAAGTRSRRIARRRRLRWYRIVLPSVPSLGAVGLVLGCWLTNFVRNGTGRMPPAGILLMMFGVIGFAAGALVILVEWRDLLERCGGRRAVLCSAGALVTVTFVQLMLCGLLSEVRPFD
ncbi:MAG: hypothetical protein IT434_06520 [Phycisphaerales bacterium]|jgi:hypothetical protein|nr:hypothetical protein [Phycisphaerales bacterium]